MISPGPGQYEEKKAIENDVMKKTQGKNGTFGCTEHRFAPTTNAPLPAATEDTPGPGHYI